MYENLFYWKLCINEYHGPFLTRRECIKDIMKFTLKRLLKGKLFSESSCVFIERRDYLGNNTILELTISDLFSEYIWDFLRI
jgi:hypothetical protein